MSWFARILGRPPTQAPLILSPPIPAPAMINRPDVVPTAELLTQLGWVRPAMWAPVLTPACEKHGIVTRLRLAAFLANTGHETGGGSVLVESLNYSAEALVSKFGRHRITVEQATRLGRTHAHPAQQEALANVLYGGEWGRKNLGNVQGDDGWRFRGRGLIQLTGRANYQRFADALGMPLDDALLARLEIPMTAAESAAHFWLGAGCNAIADAEDIEAVRKRVNGGSLGLAEVRDRYCRSLAAMAE